MKIVASVFCDLIGDLVKVLEEILRYYFKKLL